MDAYGLGRQMAKEAMRIYRPGLLTRLLSPKPSAIERAKSNREVLRRTLMNLGLLEGRVTPSAFDATKSVITRQLNDNRDRALAAVRQLRGA